jgi:ribose/xylose/arabinose/galactoside ABC-type transport system permease subunit
LKVIAAVVVGGVAISGGRGSLWGVFMGLLLLACISPALTHLRVEAYWEKAIQGAIILLAVVVLMNRYLHEKVRNTLATVAALLTLVQVFSMRWNIVIGGQLLSKSLRGLRSPYEPEIFGREGVLVAIALFVAPFVILWVFDRVLGIEEPEAGEGGHAPPAQAPAEAPAGSHVP